MTTSADSTAPVLTTPQRAFFTGLFDGLAGVNEFRALPRAERTFCEVGDEAAIAAFLAAHRWENLYFGVATRVDATGGALSNCLALPALFVDLDFKISSEAESRQRLASFPLMPSLVVATGGGLHCYWRLREPLDLRKDAGRARALLRRLATHLGADLAAAEPARILRIPGTYNFKYDPPRRVELELCLR